jgi:class 3 adenylate cyclase/tetratricopeptide (TPR) repeat protein
MSEGTRRRERKVVTVVFCDLVGFTARAESLDPEDVEALLRPYHERVRSELERHGGTVEKFIGDAVMALFGAPTAHEDDPERAVRAALAIRDFAVEEGLELRVGVTTGEALISLDARPDAGEGMASGDVVNTAARLQSAAPVNGVIVDETTYRATRAAIDYAESEAVAAKGKSTPIAVWQATAAHSRFGIDVAHEARSALVGRERELTAVRDSFDRARHGRTPQLLTLVGVPGIGKSRLVYELSQIVEADPELITWRQGRCLAYGDGVTMWALAEIVKAQSGIAEQDTPADVAEKVRSAVADVLPEEGAARAESHLLALVGLAEEAELGGNRRNEAFSAWRRFLEGLAEQRPLVLVFEDLHWADESLLDFVDELVDWITDVPLLVVATARPELLERRPNWGGGKLNATTLALAPLTDEQTARLLGGLLGTPVLQAQTQAALIERAGGNPLYAEQFAELYVERGSADDLSLPETLQGIIAARLDGLGSDEKGLLLDAAVIGKVFWTSALGRDEADAIASFHSLERKGFIRRQRRTSVEGQTELAFAHALVRDVAYGQIPRADRASKHRQVAEWIESLGRPADHAEMLAYHWSSALELVRISGGDDPEIVERTRLALRLAGDRAFSLNNFPVAAAQYEDALELWPTDDDDRPELLFRYARALYWAYDEERQQQTLESARDALLAAGDMNRAAEADVLLARMYWERGHGDLAHRHTARAQELVGDTLSASSAHVLAVSARFLELAGDYDEGRRTAEAALLISEELGLDELRAHALTTIGMAKNDQGDPAGVADMERGLEIALEIDSPIAATIVNNLAVQATIDGDLPRSEQLYVESTRLAERFGDAQTVRFVRANTVWIDFMRGRWDDALRGADPFIAECEAGSPHTNEWSMRSIRASIREGRDLLEEALADRARALELARETGEGGISTLATLALLAGTHAERGQREPAVELVAQAIPLIREYGSHGALANVTPFADELGVAEELRAAIAEGPPARSAHRWHKVVVLGLDGDFRGAADLFAETGNPTLEAAQRLFGGEHLLRQGERADGELEVRKALAFYRSVDASYYVARAEAALAQSSRESA